MADTTKNIMSLIATQSSRIKDLVIKDGQLIFIQDVGRIAFDFKGKRTFYNQIVEIETEAERISLDSPIDGYYFVIDTAVLWFYKEKWIRITEQPNEVIQIDVELPALGQAKEGTLYVNKAEREIAVFDSASQDYVIVSDYTNEITDSDIESLFM